MTEKEKMLAGEIYSAVDGELLRELAETREIIHDYNHLRPSETQKMKAISLSVAITVKTLVWARAFLQISTLLCSMKPV